jgi:hypothetical protein
MRLQRPQIIRDFLKILQLKPAERSKVTGMIREDQSGAPPPRHRRTTRHRGMAGVFATAFLVLTFCMTLPPPEARAEGYVSFGFGTSFGKRHGSHRQSHFGLNTYRPGYYGRGYYGRGYYPYRGYRHRRHHRHLSYWHGPHGYPYHTHRHRHVLYRLPSHRYVPHSHTRTLPAAAPQAAKRTLQAAPPPPARNCLMIREYQTVITIDGKQLDAYGDACMQPDGSWRRGPPKAVPEG